MSVVLPREGPALPRVFLQWVKLVTVLPLACTSPVTAAAGRAVNTKEIAVAPSGVARVRVGMDGAFECGS